MKRIISLVGGPTGNFGTSRTPGKRAPILLLALFFLLCSVPAEAYDVLVVKSANIKPYNDAVEGFRNSCNCDVDELTVSEAGKQDITAKILDAAPDAVFALGTDAFLQTQGLKIPLFYAMVISPATAGNNNATGVSMLVHPDLYFAHIAALFPDMKRVGIVHDPRATGAYVRSAAEAARARGMELVVKEVRQTRDLQPALAALRDKIDILLMVPDTNLLNSETVNALLLFSFQNRIPIFSFSRKYVEMGALAALNINAYDIGVQVGDMVRTRPAGGKGAAVRTDARKATLVYNRKVAQKLGMKPREQGLKGAEEVSRP